MADRFCQENSLDLISDKNDKFAIKHNGMEFTLTYSDMYSIDYYKISLDEVLMWIKDVLTSKRFYSIREYKVDGVRSIELLTRKFEWKSDISHLNGVPIDCLLRIINKNLTRIFVAGDKIHLQGLHNYSFNLKNEYSRFRFDERLRFTILRNRDDDTYYDSLRSDFRMKPLVKYKVIGWSMPKETFVDGELKSEIFYFKSPKTIRIFQKKGTKKLLLRNYAEPNKE